MRTEISKLHHRLGATMIYVTHDQTEAMTMGDKIVLMKDGVVHQVDTPLDIYNLPVNKFVAGFIGSPAMNFFRGSIRKGKQMHFKESSNGVDLTVNEKDRKKLAKYVGDEIVLGLRPEHLYESGQNGRGGSKTSVHVTVVEPMGNEYYIYFNTGDEANQYVARIATSKNPQVGKKLDLVFDMAKAHFFDPRTEHVI